MYQALADSKITFNYHIDISRQTNWGGNMRTYEATGCGALLLTDYAPGMENLFVPGKEVVMYRSLGELAEVLKRCLEREDETAAISKAGQAACLARHSYTQRIKEFEAILFRYCS
jgi:spore maturation protein CgeB